MGRLRNIGRLRAGGSQAFSPLSLFAAGEQGGWYDPSDLSSMFQDSAGTTAAAVESPVGLMLDERMSLGSELSPDPNFASSVGWSTSGANAVYSAGVWTITSAGGLEYISRQINAAKTANRWYKITIQVTAATSLVATVLRLYMATTAGGLTSVSSFPAISAPGSYSIFVFCGVANPFFTLMVTAGGASVSVSSMTVKDADANHLIQATAASRPTLSARYNRLTKTEQFDNAAWSKGPVTVTANAATAPDGTLTADQITADGTNAAHYLVSGSTLGAASVALVSVKTNTAGFAQISFGGDAVSCVNFNLTTGAVGALNGNVTAATATSVGNGWWQVKVSLSNTGATGLAIGVASAITDTCRQAFVSSSSIYAWGADWRTSSDAALSIPAYQRVDTASSYDTSGFPMYLSFDGVDDGMASAATVDLSGTSKLGAFAGLYKAGTDSGSGIVAELTVNTSATNGGFYLAGPDRASPSYGFAIRGTTTVASGISAATFAAPIANVVTCSYDTGAATTALQLLARVNGVASFTADGAPTSAGNFSNSTFYMGRRAGSSLPFNGRIYQLIIRGATSTATEITSAERYVGGKMGIAL